MVKGLLKNKFSDSLIIVRKILMPGSRSLIRTRLGFETLSVFEAILGTFTLVALIATVARKYVSIRNG